MKPWVKLLALLICAGLMAGACALAEGQARLPKDVKIIKSEAFLNAPLDGIVIPYGARRIEARAFAGTRARTVFLPRSLNYIAPNAFDGCDDLVATVELGSYAYDWCQRNGVSYTTLGSYETDTPVYVVTAETDAASASVPEAMVFEAYTSPEANAVGLFDSYGNLLHLATENAGLVDNLKEWRFEVLGLGYGHQTYYLAASADGVNFGDEYEIEFSSSAPDRRITDGSADDVFYVGLQGDFYLSVRGGTAVVAMYDANGTLLARWGQDEGMDAGSYPEDSFQDVILSYTFEEAGTHAVKFVASADGEIYDMDMAYGMEIDVINSRLLYMAYSQEDSYSVSDVMSFDARVSTEAQSVGIFDASNNLLDAWDRDTADDRGIWINDNSDGSQTWHDFALTLEQPGDYALYVRASADGETYTERGIPISVHVEAYPMIVTDPADYNLIAHVGTTVTIYKTASPSANYMAMYDPAGNLCHIWEREDAAEDEYWTMEWTFDQPGFQLYSLRASADGEHYGNAVGLAVNVVEGAMLSDLSAYQSYENHDLYNVDCYTTTFTQTIRVLNSDGTTLLEIDRETAEVEEYDVDSDNWRFQLTDTAAESHVVTFQAAGADGVYGPGVEYCLDKPYSEASYELSFNADSTMAGWTIHNTVYTGDDVRFVRLRDVRTGEVLTTWNLADEPFQIYESWDGSTSKKYVLDYTFSTPGLKFLGLSVSADGSAYGNESVEEYRIMGEDLIAYDEIKDLTAHVGDCHFIKMPWNDGYAYECMELFYTPTRDPGSVYIMYTSQDHTSEIRLNCPDYTLFGLKPGMTRSEVLAILVDDFGFRMKGAASLDGYPVKLSSDAPVWGFSAQFREGDWIGYMDSLYVRFEGDIVTQVIARQEAGE